MNDVTAPERAEDHLRSLLARRAEDMAPGDGVAWDPAAPVLSLPLSPTPAERRWRARPLVAAAAVVVVVAAAAVGLAARRGDEGPATADAATGGDGAPTASSPASPTASSTPPSTEAPTTPPGYDPGTPVGRYVRAGDGEVVEARWYALSAEELGAWTFPPNSEDLQAGGRSANYWEEEDQHVSSLALRFDDGLLYLDGHEVGMRQDLLAFADGVHRVTGTTDFEITPPPGYAPG